MAETVVALFLLLGGTLVCLGISIQAQQLQSNSLEAQRAATLAREALEQVRSWAQDSDNFLSSWSTYDNDTFTHPDYPGFLVRVRCAAVRQWIYSPGQVSEENRLGGGRRLDRGMPVQVVVEWGRSRSHRLDARLVEPLRRVRGTNPVTVDVPTTGPLARDAAVVAEAHLWDNTNREITGVTFNWSVGSPNQGQATIDTSQDLSQFTARFFNFVYDGDPTTAPRLYFGGNVTAMATARYAGVEYSGGSAEVELAP